MDVCDDDDEEEDEEEEKEGRRGKRTAFDIKGHFDDDGGKGEKETEVKEEKGVERAYNEEDVEEEEEVEEEEKEKEEKEEEEEENIRYLGHYPI